MKDIHIKSKENISNIKSKNTKCVVSKRCGACSSLNIPYEKQLEDKEKMLKKLFDKKIKINHIIGMKNPYNYRNKVHAAFANNRGTVISGVYEMGTHKVVQVDNCLIEDKKAREIISTIRNLSKSFKIRIYDEDRRDGLLRHVLIRRGFKSGEIMVVLVVASLVFPSKNNFVKALLKAHPDITTIVLNENNKKTSMVLGDREKVIYGKGYIMDTLCGCVFKISPKSFYQVNPVQTEILYNKAINLLELKGTETVIDAYCGIGTMGIIASSKVKKVIGVELNGDAVKDAIFNSKLNKIQNARFFEGDAGDFMSDMAARGEKIDAVIMDPPRSGSTEKFIDSIAKIKPQKVVYVSCNPETLARDLKYYKRKGYKTSEVYPVDMFPHTLHSECVCLLTKK